MTKACIFCNTEYNDTTWLVSNNNIPKPLLICEPCISLCTTLISSKKRKEKKVPYLVVNNPPQRQAVSYNNPPSGAA